MSQNDKVLQHMEKWGSITARDAYECYGIMRLGARINELRKQGYGIKTDTETGENRFGKRTHYARYRMMPGLEKTIQGLELCAGNSTCKWKKCPYNPKHIDHPNYPACRIELENDALSLLKAQEPVKPFVTGNGHTVEEAETWWYECGNCNEPIDPNDQYCRHCGRAVKWE